MPNAVDYDPFQKFGKDFDYDKIFDGRVWELVYGQDFQCTATTMRSKIQYQANIRDIEVRLMVRKMKVFVQAINPKGKK
jgi:hypothetical protein